MKISYNLTAQDFVSFQEYYIKKKAPIAGCMQPVIVSILGCNILFGIILYFRNGVTTHTYVFLACALLLGLLLILKGQNKRKMLQAAIQMEKDKPGAFGNMTMDFGDKGIDVRSSTQEKFLTWEEVERHDSNKEYIFIYSKKGMAYIIPKRDLQGMDDQLLHILDKYLLNDSN